MQNKIKCHNKASNRWNLIILLSELILLSKTESPSRLCNFLTLWYLPLNFSNQFIYRSLTLSCDICSEFIGIQSVNIH